MSSIKDGVFGKAKRRGERRCASSRRQFLTGLGSSQRPSSAAEHVFLKRSTHTQMGGRKEKAIPVSLFLALIVPFSSPSRRYIFHQLDNIPALFLSL